MLLKEMAAICESQKEMRDGKTRSWAGLATSIATEGLELMWDYTRCRWSKANWSSISRAATTMLMSLHAARITLHPRVGGHNRRKT